MISNMKFLKSDDQISVTMSFYKKYIFLDVNEIYDKLEEQLFALTVASRFTGKDYNFEYFNKGNKRFYSIQKRTISF